MTRIDWKPDDLLTPDDAAGYLHVTDTKGSGGMIPNWERELFHLLDTAPKGAAERIIGAIDANRLNMFAISHCVYGFAYNHDFEASKAACSAHGNGQPNSPLSDACGLMWFRHDFAPVRSSCVTWLAEHGSTPEPAPQRAETHNAPTEATCL